MRTAAEAIWSAAISAVLPERLVARRVSLDDLSLAAVDRIAVVGAGKAAGGMAAGIAELLGAEGLARHRVSGLVSVPVGCGRSVAGIEVRETRPAGANLPTPAVVQATQEMLAAVSALGPRDLAIALITGGGSALLAAPQAGVSLAEKIAITQRLSAAGADIATLNAARRKLSLVKGGGLARACAAGRLLVVVLSDVIGDDLDVIASGPCMPPAPTLPAGAWTTPAGCAVRHVIVGDNATAVEAAAAAARQAGYEVVPGVVGPELSAEATGRQLAAAAVALLAATRRDGQPRALIAGGEATVTVPADHGVGGRNQQTVLVAIDAVLATTGAWPEGLLVASIGTDGEDGPTDAAGAVADAAVVAAIGAHRLDVGRALARCDAYPLLQVAGGLIRTGPTGTNVADVRIVLAQP
ncbi:MAG: glycerate kinase [Planctomycetia bacterium]|nr:glycerate kinase [Planctomycetia bacterium]